MVQLVKSLPATWETQVEFLVGKISWRRKWQPIAVFLPGEFHRQRSLVGSQRVGHDWETNTTLGLGEMEVRTKSSPHYKLSSVQSLSRVSLFATPWTAACQASLSITNSRSLLKLMSISSQWCHPAISSSVIPVSSCLPNIRVFSNDSALHIRWSKYWSFSFSISPSNEYSGLISFRIDWLDLLAV